MDKAEYLEALDAEANAFITAVGGDLNSAVAGCGEWALRDLGVHQGTVWQFATANVLAAGNKAGPANPWPNDGSGTDADLGAWLSATKAAMMTALAAAEPTAPAWSFAANNHTAGFWQRRMLCETVVHRWDAENCTSNPTPIDPAMASEGIDEYTEVGLRSSSGRPNRTYPASSLHIHCSDTVGEWLIVGNGASDFTVTREHAKGDAAIRGDASALLLWIWGRDGGDVEILGNKTVATTWRELAP